MYKIPLILITLLALSGCSNLLTDVPVDDSGKPVVQRDTAKVINPEVTDTVTAGMDVWCSNLTNVRRIVLRFIHVVDPEWQSVCQSRKGEAQ